MRMRSTARIGCGPTCFRVPSGSAPSTAGGSRRALPARTPCFSPLSTSRSTGRPASGRICGSSRRTASIEVGHLAFSPLLQRTPAATEAMYLMMRQAFELGYRRYEWKCDALNAAVAARGASGSDSPSRASSARLLVYKGRNRDTAWYSIIDSEWPATRCRVPALAGSREFRRAGSPAVVDRRRSAGDEA